MILLDIAEARRYCAALQAAPPAPVRSLHEYHDGLAPAITTFSEGTTEFDDRRMVALSDVERQLFLAASNYMRALGLLVASAAPWAHVTLYYASFFAAQSIIGMFGGWIDVPQRLVEVQSATPRAITLVLRRKVKSPSNYRGSHRMFWELFYASSPALLPWTDPSVHVALTPIGASVTWQIDARNDVNYDARTAYDAVQQFPTTLSKTDFRRSLVGKISTQLHVTEAMLLAAFEFATDFGVDTHALASLGFGKRGMCIRKLIKTVKQPRLSKQSRVSQFVR